MPTLAQMLNTRTPRPPFDVRAVTSGTSFTIQTNGGPCVNATGGTRNTGRVVVIQINGADWAIAWTP